LKEDWLRRRWFDFRQGHSIYLIFLLSFSNFVLIFHRLLIERISFLEGILSELWVFVIIFVLIYIPVAIVIGVWHRKNQIKVETDVIFRQYPTMAKMFRLLIDMGEGKATKEEIEKTRKFLKMIEDGKGHSKQN
jgi:hypothetical protein